MSANMGWMGWMGWSGNMGWGGASPGADPMLPSAVILNRDATVWAPGTPLIPPLPTIDDERAFAKWSPLVRRNTALMELLRTVDFAPLANGMAVKIGADVLCELTLPSTQQSWDDLLTEQYARTEAWASERQTRLPEIAAQIGGALPMLMSAAHLQASRHAAALEVLDVVGGFAALVTLRMKHALNVPRPASLAAELQPMIPTPEHGSFPSGHATESFALAHVLAELRPGPGAALYRRTAARAAANRTVAGLHYPIDSAAGRALGTALGEYLAYRFAPSTHLTFTGYNYLAVQTEAFMESASPTPATTFNTAAPTGGGAKLLQWMWAQATTSLGVPG